MGDKIQFEKRPDSLAVQRSKARVAAIEPGTRYADPSQNVGAMGAGADWSKSSVGGPTDKSTWDATFHSKDPNPLTGMWHRLTVGASPASAHNDINNLGVDVPSPQSPPTSLSEMASGGLNHFQQWSTPAPWGSFNQSSPRMFSGMTNTGPDLSGNSQASNLALSSNSGTPLILGTTKSRQVQNLAGSAISGDSIISRYGNGSVSSKPDYAKKISNMMFRWGGNA